MKAFLFALASLTLSAAAFAAPAPSQVVAQKICDGRQIPITQEERVFVLLQQSMIGLGVTQADNCRVVDFHTITVTSSGIVNREQVVQVVVSPVPVMRKNSCNTQVVPAAPQFQSAEYTGSRLVLHGAAGCVTLELRLR